jgi:DNA polymerase-3 subunit delta
MASTPENVLNDLKNGQYAPVYFLQGEEPYYIDQISDYIEKNALEESQKGFNQVIMYGKDHPVNAIVTNARRYPMMSERQVVIVKEAQNISDLGKEVGQKLLLDYIQNPLPSTILVFCHKYKSLDKRKALGKQLDKLTVAVTTKKLYDNQIPDWVNNYVKSKGFSIDPKGTQMLADYIGTDLERLTNEIDKLLINFEEKVTINADIIQKYVGISKEYNVFELQKALQIKDVLKANRIINYFASNPKKNPIIPIIAMLYSFYSKLLLVHSAKDKSQNSLASVLKVNPFFVKDYLMAVRVYNLSQTINCIQHIKEADLRSKGVGFSHSEGELLKELVFKLIH